MPSSRLLPPLIASAALWGQQTFPMEARQSFQTLALPFPGERMGLYGLELMHEGPSGWAGGLGGYGAITGKRGGFITLGLAGAWRPSLSDHLSLDVGLFSGGGGAGRAAVGGGWMVEGHAGLDVRWDRYRLGLAYQRIHFPNGDIDSRQWRLSLSTPFAVPLATGDSTSSFSHWREFSLEATALHYQPASSVRLLDGRPGSEGLGLIGFSAKTALRGAWFFSLDMAAAHSGRADGYMEGLLGVGYRLNLREGWRVQVRMTGGPAGGGHLDVGGGMAWKASAGLEGDLGHRVFLGAEVGEVITPGASFRARTLQVSLGRRFRLGDDTESPVEPEWTWSEWSVRMRAGLAEMTRPRKEDPDKRPVRTQTLALDLPLSARFYLTGQAGFGTSGGAGGWATGLLGVGLQGQPFEGGPRFYTEALLGAGGGGGLDSRGGAIAQPMVGLAQPLGSRAEFHLRAGRLLSLHHGLSSPVVEMGLGWRFGLATVGP